MPNVVIYIKASHWQMLKEEGADPKVWVKALVARALEKKETSKQDE